MNPHPVTRPWHRGLLAALDAAGALVFRPRPSRPVRSVALLRLGSFGDLITLLPAVARARALYPEARLTWVAQPAYHGFLRELGAADDYLAPAQARWRSFDLACDFHADLPHLAWARVLARRVAGHGVRGGGFLLDHTAPYDASMPVWLRHVRLVECSAAAAPAEAGPPRIALPPRWSEAAAPLLRELPGAFVVAHPGCGQPGKRWPEAHWRAFLSQCGMPAVITGSETDADFCGRLAAATGATSLAGRTGWGELAALVAAAHCVVSPDTGVAHLAQALATPSVTLFGPTDPAAWGYASRLHPALAHRLPCSFCARARCRLVTNGEESSCLDVILPLKVLSALKEIQLNL